MHEKRGVSPGAGNRATVYNPAIQIKYKQSIKNNITVNKINDSNILLHKQLFCFDFNRDI